MIFCVENDNGIRNSMLYTLNASGFEVAGFSNPAAAETVEPLEQVIDALKEQLRTNHIFRMQEGKCTAQIGFVWSDVLSNLERVSDHCSNIAGCVIDTAEHNLNVHKSLREIRRGNEKYNELFSEYLKKYTVSEYV